MVTVDNYGAFDHPVFTLKSRLFTPFLKGILLRRAPLRSSSSSRGRSRSFCSLTRCRAASKELGPVSNTMHVTSLLKHASVQKPKTCIHTKSAHASIQISAHACKRWLRFGLFGHGRDNYSRGISLLGFATGFTTGDCCDCACMFCCLAKN